MERTVLTTGANSGIGLATVLEVARAGFRSIGTVRSDDKALDVAKAAADAGVSVETVLLDVADAEACERVMSGLELYGLVNNAGYPGNAAVEDSSDEQARHLLEVMAIAPMRLARLALPAMRACHAGRIINLSSIYGRTTIPLGGWYQGAKYALEAVSDGLRMEVAGDGVKVVLVEPGGVKTNLWSNFEDEVGAKSGSRFSDAYSRTRQITRLASPFMTSAESVAKVVVGALKSSHPRPRYLVGYDAMALSLARQVTPTRIEDRVVRFLMGL